MGDLLGSFPGRARVRPKCAGKTCVDLWGQSTISMSSHRWSVGLGCYMHDISDVRPGEGKIDYISN